MRLTAPEHIRGRMPCGTPAALVQERLEWMKKHRMAGATIEEMSEALCIAISSVQRILIGNGVHYRRPIKHAVSRFISCGVKPGSIRLAIAAMPAEAQERLLRDAARSGKSAAMVLAEVYASARAEARGGANV